MYTLVFKVDKDKQSLGFYDRTKIPTYTLSDLNGNITGKYVAPI